MIEVPSRDDLGEWLGHCQYDKDGSVRKVKGTSSACILDYGEETVALAFVQRYIKDNGL